MHAKRSQQVLKSRNVLRHFNLLCADWSTGQSYMVEQAAWCTIRSVYGTREPPRLGKEFADSGCFHLCEVLATMY